MPFVLTEYKAETFFSIIIYIALEDPDEMFEALKSGDGIDGILEELFTGIESMKRKDPSKQLSVAKFIWHSRAFGVAYRNDLFEKYISDCLSNVIKFRYNDVLRITSNYIRATEVRVYSFSYVTEAMYMKANAA